MDVNSTPTASTDTTAESLEISAETRDSETPVPKWCPELGFIYLIQCGRRGGPVKIGRAEDVDARLRSLQVGCPYPLTLIASMLVAESEKVETALHGRFRSLWIRGEWFEGSQDVLGMALQITNLARDQAAQLKTSGPPTFSWRDAARVSVVMPDPAVLFSTPLGERPERDASCDFVWRGQKRKAKQ